MDRQELQVQATGLLVVECRRPRNPAVISQTVLAHNAEHDTIADDATPHDGYDGYDGDGGADDGEDASD